MAVSLKLQVEVRSCRIKAECLRSIYLNNFSRVVIWNFGGPSCADSVCAIDENHGEDGDVEVGFYLHVVVLEIVQNVVIVWVEDVSGQRAHLGENVTRGGVVLAASQPIGTE